jgi:hypothetical protein
VTSSQALSRQKLLICLHYSPDGKLLAVCGPNAIGNTVIRVRNVKDWSVANDIKDSAHCDCRAFEFTQNWKHLFYPTYHFADPGDNVVAYEVGTWQGCLDVQSRRYCKLCRATEQARWRELPTPSTQQLPA